MEENYSPLKLPLGEAGGSIVTSKRRNAGPTQQTFEERSVSMIDRSITKDVESFIRSVAAPMAQPTKFGGPSGSFTTANKDYGNFVDSKRIDEIILNVRQLR